MLRINLPKRALFWDYNQKIFRFKKIWWFLVSKGWFGYTKDISASNHFKVDFIGRSNIAPYVESRENRRSKIGLSGITNELHKWLYARKPGSTHRFVTVSNSSFMIVLTIVIIIWNLETVYKTFEVAAVKPKISEDLLRISP